MSRRARCSRPRRLARPGPITPGPEPAVELQPKQPAEYNKSALLLLLLLPPPPPPPPPPRNVVLAAAIGMRLDAAGTACGTAAG